MKKINVDKQEVVEQTINVDSMSTTATAALHLLCLITLIVISGIAISSYFEGVITKEELISIILMSVLFFQYYNSKVHRFRTANVQFDNVHIFNNFNLYINGNKSTAMFGNIGAGKTSLLKMIVGLVKYSGDIYIDGQNLKLIKKESLNSQIAYIPQNTKLFNKDVFYNLQYGTNYTKSQIIQFVTDFGFIDFINKLPNKLDTHVGKEGAKLSGGQRQIIFILRALLQNKKIILLDEPTSALDRNMSAQMINLITNIKNRTIIVVTHDDLIANKFDESIMIK